MECMHGGGGGGVAQGTATSTLTARQLQGDVNETAYLGPKTAAVSKQNVQKKKLHGLSPRANYTDRATAASRRSGCQLLRIKGATW
jgi:hypothetical protein